MTEFAARLTTSSRAADTIALDAGIDDGPREDGGVGNDGMPGLAEKLNHLFATVPGPTKRGLYSNEVAAKALAERGVVVSGVHLSHLRSGRRDNPSARLLAALADLFDVPIGYFFDPSLEAQTRDELDALVALKDSRVKSLMLKAQGVSAESLSHLDALLDRIRQLEGLDMEIDEERH